MLVHDCSWASLLKFEKAGVGLDKRQDGDDNGLPSQNRDQTFLLFGLCWTQYTAASVRS